MSDAMNTRFNESLLQAVADMKPVSEILSDLDKSVALLEVHARLAMNRNDMKAYLSLNALAVIVADSTRKFTVETAHRLDHDDDDEPRLRLST